MCDSTAQAARAARASSFVHEPRRQDISIPADDETVGLSIFRPPVAAPPPRAAYLHIHGGGFVMGSAYGPRAAHGCYSHTVHLPLGALLIWRTVCGYRYGQNDARLQRMADELHIAVVSVEYRLAPEATFPAPLDDCVAAALWLAESGRQVLGTDVFLIGGESAGGHLCVSTLLR